MKKLILLLTVFSCVIFGLPDISCAQSAKDAINALKKLDTVVKTGVSYRDYPGALSEAKFPVRLYLDSKEAKAVKSITLNLHLELAVRHYDSALRVWDLKFKSNMYRTEEVFTEKDEAFWTVQGPYPDAIQVGARGNRFLSITRALPVIWDKAAESLRDAEAEYSKLTAETERAKTETNNEREILIKEKELLKKEIDLLKEKIEILQNENAALKIEAKKSRSPGRK